MKNKVKKLIWEDQVCGFQEQACLFSMKTIFSGSDHRFIVNIKNLANLTKLSIQVSIMRISTISNIWIA